MLRKGTQGGRTRDAGSPKEPENGERVRQQRVRLLGVDAQYSLSLAVYVGMKPYAATKDSGVQWLGDVPAHWGTQRLKSLVCNLSEQTVGRPKGTGYIALEHVESWTGRVTNEAAEPGDGQLKHFEAEDVLFGKLRPYLAKVVYAESPGVCVGEFFVLRARMGISPRYLAFVLRSKLAIDWISGSTFGARMPRADWTFVGDVSIPVPGPTEQTSIARFLDHATSRIDRYIRAKEKLIALLEEQQRTYIELAVTGQIEARTGRRFSTYKRSGLDWLGEMPEHWQLVRNGRVFAQRNESGHPELPILEVSLRRGVRVRGFGSSGRKQVMSDRSLYKRAAQGDIAYNMMRMRQGAVGVAPTDGLVSPAYIIAKPMPEIDSRYFDHLYHTGSYMTEVDKYSRGIVKDRNRLYWEDFKQMPSPCPPSDEQAAIADALDRRMATTGTCNETSDRRSAWRVSTAAV